jgi:hypothetical protein
MMMTMIMMKPGYRVAAQACVGAANVAVGGGGVRVCALRKHVLERFVEKTV